MKRIRDEKGRFVKGCSGNPDKIFTSKKQPKNPGRKPSRFKQLIADLEGVGETMSLEDFRKISLFLLTMNKDELVELAKNSKAPMAVVAVASAIAGDIEYKSLKNIESLLDRLFGKAMQPVETVVGTIDSKTAHLSEEEIEAEIKRIDKALKIK